VLARKARATNAEAVLKLRCFLTHRPIVSILMGVRIIMVQSWTEAERRVHVVHFASRASKIRILDRTL